MFKSIIEHNTYTHTLYEWIACEDSYISVWLCRGYKGRLRACNFPSPSLSRSLSPQPLQKVHCIYKSFIMNYTMLYLKWEACLVPGYMGYRDYNARALPSRASSSRGKGEYNAHARASAVGICWKKREKRIIRMRMCVRKDRRLFYSQLLLQCANIYLYTLIKNRWI